jgi:hypothetical protein
MLKIITGRWKSEVGDAIEELENSIAKFSKKNNYDPGNIISYHIMHEPQAVNSPSYIYIATALVAFYEKAMQVAPLLAGVAEEPNPGTSAVRYENWIPGTNPPKLIRYPAEIDMSGDPDMYEV